MADEDIRELYERLPYPRPGSSRTTSVSASWLRGAVHPKPAPFRDGARILVAGCGTGAEAEHFSTAWPGAGVVGIDVSEAAIAQAKSADSRVQYLVLDLLDSAAVAALGPFDFISCHAVADYIRDSNTLLEGLAGALSESGVLLISANTPSHPKDRVNALFDAVGPAPREELLALCSGWMGPIPGMGELTALPEDVVSLDLFPPHAHHRPPAAWFSLAAQVGLHPAGIRRASAAVLTAGDQAQHLFHLDRVQIGLLSHRVFPSPSAWMLFAHQPLLEPDWRSDLGAWVPMADPSVPVAQIAPAEGDWEGERSLTVALDGAQYIVPISVRGLEILRRSDGRTPLDAMSVPGGWERARLDLFRLFHTDLLHFAR